MGILRSGLGYILAVIAATVGLSFYSTFSVLQNLKTLGYRATLPEQVSAYIGDLAGMAPAAGGVNAIGLFIAFAVASLVIRFLWDQRTLGYTLAGLVALTVEMMAMGRMFGGITPIAGARTTTGLIVIALVGAIAGFLFSRVSPER